MQSYRKRYRDLYLLFFTGHMFSGAGYPVVGDLDGVLDGQGLPTVELATGSEVYRFNRTTRTWDPVWVGGAICVSQTTVVLYAGDCEAVTCSWADPPTDANDAVDVTVVVDDDGTGAGENSECFEGNNLATLPGVVCTSVQ